MPPVVFRCASLRKYFICSRLSPYSDLSSCYRPPFVGAAICRPRAINNRPYIFYQKLFDKLEFGGQWPLTMRAQCSAFRYCPNPLGIVTAEQLDKLEFISLQLSLEFYLHSLFLGLWKTHHGTTREGFAICSLAMLDE